jgi:hypothetical protein
MADQYTDPHEGTAEPEPEWEEEWRTHREWMETERQDTLIRHGHTFTACVVRERTGRPLDLRVQVPGVLRDAKGRA